MKKKKTKKNVKKKKLIELIQEQRKLSNNSWCENKKGSRALIECLALTFEDQQCPTALIEHLLHLQARVDRSPGGGDRLVQLQVLPPMQHLGGKGVMNKWIVK